MIGDLNQGSGLELCVCAHLCCYTRLCKALKQGTQNKGRIPESESLMSMRESKGQVYTHTEECNSEIHIDAPQNSCRLARECLDLPVLNLIHQQRRLGKEIEAWHGTSVAQIHIRYLGPYPRSLIKFPNRDKGPLSDSIIRVILGHR